MLTRAHETMSGLNQKILIRHGTLHPIEHEKSDIELTEPHEWNKSDASILLNMSDHPDFKKLIKPYQ